MEKIQWKNNEPPAISADNLNQMQDNTENAINDIGNTIEHNEQYMGNTGLVMRNSVKIGSLLIEWGSIEKCYINKNTEVPLLHNYLNEHAVCIATSGYNYYAYDNVKSSIAGDNHDKVLISVYAKGVSDETFYNTCTYIAIGKWK